MTKNTSPNYLIILGLVAIVAATLLAYSPAMRGGFVWNDNTYVHQNRLLSDPSLVNLGKIWAIKKVTRPNGVKCYSSNTEQYYPLVFSSFWIESRVWGNSNPTGFHVVNVLLHIANALLVWMICRRLEIGWGWLIAAVFALHPVAVESVAWITERKNVLSGLFYLLAVLSYLRFDRDRRWGFYAISLTCFILGLLSKTVVCTLPVVLLLILWVRHKKFVWAELARLIPFLVIGTGFGLLTAYLEKHSVGAAGTQWQIAFWQRLIIAGKAVFFYMSKLLWPTNLAFIYPRWKPSDFSALGLLWPLAVVGMGGILWWFRKAIGRSACAAWIAFVVTLGPALGFIDVYPFRYSFVADHFQYLAMIFSIILLVGLVHQVYKRVKSVGLGTLMIGAIAVCLIILGDLTYVQAGSYINTKSLWLDTTSKNPQAWMAWNNLGAIHMRERDFPAARNCFEKLIELRPDYPPAQANYGKVLAIQGEFNSAIKHFNKAIKLQSDYVWAHLNLANVYAQLRQYEQAIAAYQRTIKLAEKSALILDQRNRRIEALSKLAGVYAETGQYGAAVGYARRALELSREYGLNGLVEKLRGRVQRYRELNEKKTPGKTGG
ncbi:MAG: tetratricopeptide repeat protein [Actinobacteria bacterium]|nr:tetratricopeptide repeat protein [Actinomycetota bacterium]